MEAERIEREREFHNSLADGEFEGRRLINRLSFGFYGKDDASPLWGPVWSKLELSGKKVLDYGCGDGGFSIELARRGAFVEGIDISDSLVKLAARSMPPGLPTANFSVRDAHATGYPDNLFDYVFGNGILHHLEVEKAYREVVRLLKPNGRAFFMEPMEHHPLLVLLRKATPKARSVDEKPLDLAEIKMAERYFREVRRTEHFVLAVLAAPLHLTSRKAAIWFIKRLDRLDRGMIRLVPGLGRYAWLSMVELAKA